MLRVSSVRKCALGVFLNGLLGGVISYALKRKKKEERKRNKKQETRTQKQETRNKKKVANIYPIAYALWENMI